MIKEAIKDCPLTSQLDLIRVLLSRSGCERPTCLRVILVLALINHWKVISYDRSWPFDIFLVTCESWLFSLFVVDSRLLTPNCHFSINKYTIRCNVNHLEHSLSVSHNCRLWISAVESCNRFFIGTTTMEYVNVMANHSSLRGSVSRPKNQRFDTTLQFYIMKLF